jgi:hypothetical protein
MLIGAVIMAGGTVVFLLTFWWEHDFMRRAFANQLDAEQSGYAERLESLLRERNAIDWIRVLGGFAMLVGLLVAIFS